MNRLVVALAAVLVGACQAPPRAPAGTPQLYEIEETSPRFVTAEALGYHADPTQVCAQRFSVMYQPARDLCLIASDGCIQSFARSLGFEVDAEQVCPALP